MSITNYEGKILIASPQITSTIFRKSVVYIHTHNEKEGAIGVMLNVPVEIEAAERFSHDINWPYPDRIYHGGPVDYRIGYVIHSNDYARESSIKINDDMSYTSGRHIVDDINRGVGPNDYILATGYCGWKPGQLENEVDSGMWVAVDYDKDFFFQNLDREHGHEFAINVAAENKTNQLLDMVDTA